MVKCTKINVGFIPNPARGAYSTPLDLRAGKKGPTSKGRQGYRVGRQEREGRQEKGGDGKGVEGTPHVSLNFPKEKGKNTCTQQ